MYINWQRASGEDIGLKIEIEEGREIRAARHVKGDFVIDMEQDSKTEQFRVVQQKPKRGRRRRPREVAVLKLVLAV